MHSPKTCPLFSTHPTIIACKYTRNGIVRVNRAAAQAFGLHRSKIEEKSAYDIFPFKVDKHFQNDQDVIRSGEPKLRHRRTDDRWQKDSLGPDREGADSGGAAAPPLAHID
jgi:PAS domain-containing protein